MNNKGISQISGIIILFLLALGGGIGIYATASSSRSIDSTATIKSFERDSNQEIYSNETYGIYLVPPTNWITNEATSANDGINTFLVVSFRDEATDNFISVSVLNPEMEGIVRNSLSLEKESQVQFGNLEGVRLDGTDLKDGSVVTFFLASNDDYLYQITSYAPAEIIDNFIEGINITK